MLTEGYAAVTARRLAAKAGLKSQLLHYYFGSIDDLFVEVIRRRCEANLQQMIRTLTGNSQLEAMWAFSMDHANARLSLEFLALAGHRSAVRDEVKRYADQHRIVQTAAITRFCRERGYDSASLPLITAVVLTSFSQTLTLESAHDVTMGHRELREFIKNLLAGLSGRAPLTADALLIGKPATRRPKRSGKIASVSSG